MAKTTKKETTDNSDLKIVATKKQYRMLFGFVLILFSIALLVSFVSYFISKDAF